MKHPAEPPTRTGATRPEGVFIDATKASGIIEGAVRPKPETHNANETVAHGGKDYFYCMNPSPIDAHNASCDANSLFALVCCGISTAFLALFLAFACGATAALAEDIDTDPSADAFQQEVERTSAAYDEAKAAAEGAAAALEENSQKIAELEKQIPLQEERSSEAACELYKLQRQPADLINLLLDTDNFFDFLTGLDYIDRITAANKAEIERLNEMKAELDETQRGLEQAKREADAQEAEAERALAAAQEARLEAQRKAREAEQQAAEAAAAARIATQDATSPQSTVEAAQEDTSATATSSDDADWSTDEDVFVSSWTERINAYLAGSPLAGQGRAFAQAAWDYGVDPRWSPAIAYTESSLGAHCFLPHNAWGWGSVSWSSWEEAIDAHVRGLARGYGYTISMGSAKKYCPPNYQHWYDTTLAQMNAI